MTKGKVYFIGAGPGDPELITVKGQKIIEAVDLVLYAGSLVPQSIVGSAKANAQVIDSSPLNLEQIYSLMHEATHKGQHVARVHTGDPSLFGTIREQALLLNEAGIKYEIIPGVTTACAAAAAAGISFTIPEITQSLVITRTDGRTPMPPKEQIRSFAALGCSMAIYLSAHKAKELEAELCQVLPHDTSVLCAYRVGWPEQKLVWSTISTLYQAVNINSFERQTIFLVLPGQNAKATASKLYDAQFQHGWRKVE